MRQFFRYLILTLLVFWSPLCLAEGQAIPRTIIAFYNPVEDTEDYFFSVIHQRAEMVLNHLGLSVVFYSVNDPFPTDIEMENVRGMITWFGMENSWPNPEQACVWLDRQIKNGKKLVVLGHWGVGEDLRFYKPNDPCVKMMNSFGISYTGNLATNAYFYNVDKKDSSMVEFERPLYMPDGFEYRQYTMLDKNGESFLTISRKDMENSSSDLVLITSHGGFAAPTFIYFEHKGLDKTQWRINPFEFFSRAFDMQGVPCPDVTTINGRRIFYTHVDGDGFYNISQVDQRTIAGQVFKDQILDLYPSLPITLSMLVGYLDLPIYQEPKNIKSLKDVFSLPQVELGLHGYSHPFIWKKGIVGVEIPGYKYTPEGEIDRAYDRFAKFLSDEGIEKKIVLYQWTGNCLVPLRALKRAVERGLLNINGGDPFFDNEHPGYATVSALGILRYDYRQVYTSGSNENVYTNLWKGPYYGFSRVLQTFANTESPRRIKPINVYYHYYIGERTAAIRSLKQIYDTVLSWVIFPVHTSEYVRIVQSFFSASIYREGDGFRVVQDGYLTTLRFDEESRFVDLGRSKGVLGFVHYQNSLYVHLNGETEQVVYLSTNKPNKPYLIESNCWIKSFESDSNGIVFEKRGWFDSEIILGGMQPLKKYSVDYSGKEFIFSVNDQGILRINLPGKESDGAYTKVEIKN